MEPNIEPCCISDKNIWKTLSCHLFLRGKIKHELRVEIHQLQVEIYELGD